jgi:hypothetical protein
VEQVFSNKVFKHRLPYFVAKVGHQLTNIYIKISKKEDSIKNYKTYLVQFKKNYDQIHPKIGKYVIQDLNGTMLSGQEVLVCKRPLIYMKIYDINLNIIQYSK